MRLLLAVLWLSVLMSLPAFAFDRIPPGDAAQNFKLYDRGGELHDFHSYRGKFALVSFWTVDCRHCREDMIQLEIAYRQLKPLGFEVIAINAGDPVARVQELLDINPTSYLVLLDSDLALKEWGVPSIPTAYLVAPDGQRLYRFLGPQQWGSPMMIDRLKGVLRSYD